MIPEFTVFGQTVSTYSLMALLAAAAFFAMSWRPLRRRGLTPVSILIVLALVCAAFFAGARLWNVAVNPDSYGETRPWYIFKMTGFSMYGGLTGALIVSVGAALVLRVRPEKVLDALTVPGGSAFCIARLGCFLNGCCSGKETSLPWGVVFPTEANGEALAGAVHPTQLYELFLALIGIPICLFIVKKARAKEGGLFFLYGTWFCTMRLIVHPFRALPYSPLVTNLIYPLIYYVLIVLGVFLFARSCRALAPERSSR